MKLKRILATTVSLAMLLGSTSASVFAGEVSSAYKSSLRAAGDTAELFGDLTDGKYVLSSDTYTLKDNVETGGMIYVPSGVTATIDLGGYTLRRPLSAIVEEGSIIEVAEGGSLTVKNGTLTGGGRAKTSNDSGNGAGCCVYGTLVLDSVTITGCYAQGNGGGVYVGGDTGYVTIKGNSMISSNYFSGHGGGICAGESGTVSIEGSVGVMYNASMSASDDNGAGIYVCDDAKLLMKGSVGVLNNNGSSNVYLTSGRKISLSGKLEAGSNVRISYADEGMQIPFTSGYGTSGSGSNPGNLFTLDSGAKLKLSSGEVYPYFEYEALSWDETQGKVIAETKQLTDYILIDKVDTAAPELTDGNWYVVTKQTNLAYSLICQGEVNIVLCDGITFTCSRGVNVPVNTTLNVYGQKNNTGRLIGNGINNSAGIGGKSGESCGSINIFGGYVSGTGYYQCAGIGSGKGADMAGTITIYGGTVSATGGENVSANSSGAPGIGSSVDGNFTGSLIVYGGTIYANAKANAAGIGAAHFGEDEDSGNMSGSVTVYGGVIDSTGNGFGAGIGTSYSGAGTGNGGNFRGKVLVYGGNVTAKGGYGTATEDGTAYDCHAPAIGSGTDTTTGTINLGDYMRVSQKGTYAAAKERVNACRETGDKNANNWVIISKCDHSSSSYTPVSDAKHQKTCNHCLYEVVEDHAFGLDGTCPCGMSQAGSGTHLAGYSIILDGEIGVNFYVEFSADDVSNGDPYIEFSIPSGSTTKTHKVYINEKAGEDRELATVDTTTISGKTYYVFKCPVAAKEMTSTITAQVSFGDTNGPTYTYCVKDYADYVLNHGSDPKYTNAVPLVKAMLNYGTYAQYYFGTNLNKLANADLAPNERSLGTVEIEHEACSVVGLPDQVTFEGANLYLKSGTILSLYFKNKSGSDVTFKLGNKEIVPKKNKGFLQIDIDIKSYELMNDFTITVGDGSVTYSPMNYCKTVLNGGSTYSSQLKDIVKALYRFAEAANAYQG